MYVAGFLEAIGSLQPPPTNLETIVAEVEGPASWSPSRLAWLSEDVGHRRIRQLRDNADAITAEEDAASQLSKSQIDNYSARWNILRKAVQTVVCIKLKIVEEYYKGRLSTIAEPLSRILQSEKLVNVTLTYKDPDDCMLLDNISFDELAAYRMNSQDLLVQLAKKKPWPAI